MADNETKSNFTLDGNADGLVAAMQRGTKAVQEGTDLIGGAFGKIGGSINSVIGIFGTLGAVIAGGAAFKGIVSQTVSWDLESAKLAKTLGVTTQEASVLKVALHSVGIEQDVASAAALRMANTMNKNADAFKAIGVDIDGMKKSGKSNIDMMIATIQALNEYKGGLDRNQVAMTIFGRSWGELQQLMKLTPQTFREAQETAERLHLIVGPEGVEKARQYKKSLAELELVKTSLAHTAGTELLGALTELGALMQGPAVKSAHAFAVAMHEVHDGIRDVIKAHDDWKANLERGISVKATDAVTLFLVARAAMTGHYSMIPTLLKAGYQAGRDLRHDDMDMSDMTMAGVPEPGKVNKQAPLRSSSGSSANGLSALKGVSAIKDIDALMMDPAMAGIPAATILTHYETLKQAAKEYHQDELRRAGERVSAWVATKKAEEDTDREAWEQSTEYARKAGEMNRQNLDSSQGMLAAMAESRLQYLGKEEEALDLHYARQEQKLLEEYQREIVYADQIGADKTLIAMKYSAQMEQMEQEKAQRLADIWWNSSQTYINFAQQMSTMGLQYLFFEEEERGQIGQRMLATSIRFLGQGLQQFMFHKAQEHLLAAAGAVGRTKLDTASALANLGTLQIQSTAWAAFFAAMALNPIGGEAFIPAAAAMTAVAGGAVPAAMGAVTAVGATSIAGELGMAALWAAGGIAAGALGEAGASAIEGGTKGATTPAGYGGGSYGSPVVTQPVASSQAPQVTVVLNMSPEVMIGNTQAVQKWIEDDLAPLIKEHVGRGVNFGLVPS